MLQNRRRNSQTLPSLLGLCGMFALSGPILAAEPAPAPKAPVKFRVTMPKDAKNSYPVNGFVFEGGAFNPSYSPPPQPRAMPTAMTVSGAANMTTQQGPGGPEASATTAAALSTPGATGTQTSGGTRTTTEAPAKPRPRVTVTEQPEPKPKAHHHAADQGVDTAPAPHHHYEGKEFKEAKPILPLEVAETVQFTGSAGYYSKYMFRGLDVGYQTGIDSGNDSGFFATQAAMAYKGFALGVGFIESLDPYVHRGSATNDDFGHKPGTNPLNFRTPSKERYKEYDLFANYTYHFTDTLALTAGMNFYWFADGRSWSNGGENVSNTMEAAVSLTYTGLPWVNQSLNYYYDFDAFKGSYIEYKIAAKPIQVFEEGSFSINIIPSATVSADFRYNGSNNGWNALEPGIDVPIQIADGLVLNLGARYSMDLGSASGNGQGGYIDRTDDRFWFSAAVQYSFPNRGWNPFNPAPTHDKDGKDKIVVEEKEHPWNIEVGAGVRSISTNFHLRATPVLNLGRRAALGGDSEIATTRADARYADGNVYSASENFNTLLGQAGVVGESGGSSFSFKNGSQLNDPGNGNNRQVTYHSEQFLAKDAQSHSIDSRDDDEPVYPYLNLSRDIWKKDKMTLSLGIGYQYARSETDSGYRMTGISTNTASSFTYDLAEGFSNLTANPQAPFDNHYQVFGPGGIPNQSQLYFVIYDPKSYQNTFGAFAAANGVTAPFPGVQKSEQATRAVVAFKKSTLDTDLHVLSVPLELKFDVTDRIHVGISVGPTFNLFNNDLETQTDYQLVDLGADAPQTKNHKAPFFNSGPNQGKQANVPIVLVGGNIAIAAGPGGLNAVPARGGSPQPQPTGGNAKIGQGAKSQNLPGNNIKHISNRTSDQHFELGVFGQASVDIDLDAAKRWYVQLYARYDYVPEFTVSDGASDAAIDASSFGGGVGLGFRF